MRRVILAMMAKPPEVGLRNASGLALSRECTFWFWLAYFALLLAVFGLIATEVLWRLPDLTGFYFIEAVLVLCAPLGVLFVCDRLTLETYSATWFDLRDRGRALLLLERDSVETIRRELRWNPVLMWLRPPASRDVASQLMTAALWYRAIMAPEGAGAWRRYSEPNGWARGFGLRLGLTAGLMSLVNGAAASQWPLLLAAVPGGLMFGLFGIQQLTILARRQAILDYFAVHLNQ
jgi:hypothetical protein